MNTVQDRLNAGVRAAREAAALRAEVADLQRHWAEALAENRRLGKRNTELAEQLDAALAAGSQR